MQTSLQLLRQVRRAVVAAFLLGGFSALLQLAIPLFALHAIDAAIPAHSNQTLLLLALLAAVALAALACVTSVRARILLRAGLWLDHTLGAHALQTGLRRNAQPEAMAADATAIARVRTALSNGTALALLDAPWILLILAAFAGLDWRFALVALAAALVLGVRLLFAARAVAAAARHADTAAQRVTAWWQTATRMTGLDRMPLGATEQWERLNREHVASAYGLGSRTASLADFARLVRALALVCLLTLGCWLVMTGELTTGLLVASVLLLWRMFEPVDKLLVALPDVIAARDAWRHVSGIADSEPDTADARAVHTTPRLHIAGPLAAGLAAVAMVFALGAGLAASTSLGQLAVLAGAPLFETQVTAIYPARAGIAARVLVADGARVEKGDVLATLDTRSLDARITTLRLQAQTAQIELRSLTDEAAALTAPGATPLRSRAPIEKLEARIAHLGRQSQELSQRIQLAEEELVQSRIVSPVAGRVARISARAGMPLETDAPLASIVTADATLLARLLAPFGGVFTPRAQPQSSPSPITTAAF